MPLRWALAGCKTQALALLGGLEDAGFSPDFIAVPPHAGESDRVAMKAWADRRDIKLWFSRKLLEHVHRLDGLDLLLLCRFELLPPAVFALPRLGTINVHCSLLPRYRGVHPVSWAIVEGASETGVTIHAVDAGVDTGAILKQRAVAIRDDHDLHSLTRDLDRLSAALIVDLITEICARGSLPPGRPQVGPSSYARRRRPTDGRIDWCRPARETFNLVRALPAPLPPAFAEREDGSRIEFTACELLASTSETVPGRVLADGTAGQVIVACGDGRMVKLTTSDRVATGERLR